MTKAVKTIRCLRKGRCVLLLLAIFILFNLLLGADLEQPAVADDGMQIISISIKSGDTLWDIVEQHYHGIEDLRKIIYDVKQINNLKDASIYPGQVILVPTK